MTTFTGTRRIAYAAATTVVIAALVSAGATTASAASDDFTLQTDGFLTLPAGDAFNDQVTLDIAGSAEATVDVTVTDATTGLESTIAADVALTARTTGYGFEVPVPVAGLTAGIHEVRVENSADETSFATTQLIVGSGAAIASSLALSGTKVFPYKDGYRDSSRVTIVAIDETGTKLPISGTALLKIGAKSSRVTLDKTGKALLPVSRVGYGNGSVSATITDPSGAKVSPNAKKLVVATTGITKVGLSVPKTVYPKKDGYVDTARISVAATSSTGKPLHTTGTVSISFKGKTVKAWKINSSSSKALSWNALNKKKIKTGKYTVKYSTVGPQGSRQTRTATISVSDKKLVTRTTSVWMKADKVIKSFVPLDEFEEGYCAKHGGTVACIGYDAYADDTLSLFASGAVSVPSKVRSSSKVRTPQVRVSIDVASLYGEAAWSYGFGDHLKTSLMREGTSTNGWLSLTGNPSKVGISAGLGEYSFFYADRFRVEYRYYQLK